MPDLLPRLGASNSLLPTRMDSELTPTSTRSYTPDTTGPPARSASRVDADVDACD